jgi:hypothetical protein
VPIQNEHDDGDDRIIGGSCNSGGILYICEGELRDKHNVIATFLDIMNLENPREEKN